MPLMDILVPVTTAVLGAVLGAWLARRHAARARRDDLVATKLHELATALTEAARDLRDTLGAGDACTGCGVGVDGARVHEIAERVDRTVDLALAHVRNEDLRDRLVRVPRAAEEVLRHRRRYRDGHPCPDLARSAYLLAIQCDRRADECLNYVHEGKAVIEPAMPRRRPLEWLLDVSFGLVERFVLGVERLNGRRGGAGA